MKTRLVLASLLLSVLVPGCSSTPERAPHPGIGIIDLEQPSGWFGIHMTSEKRRIHLVVRAIDGATIRDPKIPAGLSLSPGTHSITLSARRMNYTRLGVKVAGNLGGRLGRELDQRSSSPNDRTLTFTVIPGHEYSAHMRSHGSSYDYWIDDETEDRTVATTRL